MDGLAASDWAALADVPILAAMAWLLKDMMRLSAEQRGAYLAHMANMEKTHGEALREIAAALHALAEAQEGLAVRLDAGVQKVGKQNDRMLAWVIATSSAVEQQSAEALAKAFAGREV